MAEGIHLNFFSQTSELFKNSEVLLFYLQLFGHHLCIPYNLQNERTFPMADISAIFFILLILGVAFPALLAALS